jgi:ATP-dependent DNA ligase
MIKQCKGKDLGKVPKSKLGNLFYLSIKYDGHYVQIHKVNDTVRFFTSGGKEFYHALAADAIIKALGQNNAILEAEFISNTDGKLGNRGKAAKLTTYRTNFEKGLGNLGLNIQADKFMVFDIIIDDLDFDGRLKFLQSFDFKHQIELVEFFGPYTLAECQEVTRGFVNKGFEGTYIKAPTHKYYAGKRVNDAIKLKLRPTADLYCRSVLSGEGKYAGMVGSLVLQDSLGRSVQVGSGLTDIQRGLPHEYFIGKVIEIEYEQILETYIQPTFIRVRDDKTKEEID